MNLEWPRPILRQGQWGKMSKCHLKGVTGRKWANGLKFIILKKKVEGIGRPPDWGNIYVCYHDILL